MQVGFNIYNPDKCRNRWILYLDLLGFRKHVVRDGSDCNTLLYVVERYSRSRKIMEEWVKETRTLHRMPRLHLACFSDTFLIYAEDETAASFARVEQAARFMMNRHLDRHLPIRGALSCGALYADKQKSTYIGSAFIEAYDHAENQDWIGLLLCRSATRRLADLGLPPSRRLNYRRWAIPWNKKKMGQKPLYAYLIGASGSINGKNIYIGVLREMMKTATTRREKNKYLKTIRFLERFGALRAVSPPSLIA